MIDFVIDVLLAIYSFTGNLGIAIIAFTILVRSLLLPITLPSLKAMQKMKDLQPEIKKLKEKHSDKKKLQLAQMELYKKYNVNPLAGCLPQLAQLGILVVLYQALTRFLQNGEVHGVVVDPQFLWLDLSNPDTLYILPVLAGVTQLFLSLMLAPATEIPDVIPNKSTKKVVKEANKKEEDIAEMAQQMQQQMLYIMPVMTGVFALNFPSGLALYWVATTVYSVVQQYFISGPGGLMVYSQRIKRFLQK